MSTTLGDPTRHDRRTDVGRIRLERRARRRPDRRLDGARRGGGAILADRQALQTDRCLTYVNEDAAPFPDWVDPAWHHTAVGCLRCQHVCPENAAADLLVAPAEIFDEDESAPILTATPPHELALTTRDKLARCGLDYSPALIARNLHALIDR